MPIPKPHNVETQNEFMQRCMTDNIMVDEYDDKQRIAVCEHRWRTKDKTIDEQEGFEALLLAISNLNKSRK